MGKDEKTNDEKIPSFEKQPEKRDFLKVISYDREGKTIFPQLEKATSFDIRSWEWFTKAGEEDQIALVLVDSTDKEHLFPIGKSNQYIISDKGIEHPDELVNGTIQIATYETGSSGNFAIGKKIVSVTLAA